GKVSRFLQVWGPYMIGQAYQHGTTVYSPRSDGAQWSCSSPVKLVRWSSTVPTSRIMYGSLPGPCDGEYGRSTWSYRLPSEERRVGKECRCWWSACHEIKREGENNKSAAIV